MMNLKIINRLNILVSFLMILVLLLSSVSYSAEDKKVLVSSYITYFFIGVGAGLIITGLVLSIFRHIEVKKGLQIAVIGVIVFLISLSLIGVLGISFPYLPSLIFLVVLGAGGCYLVGYWESYRGKTDISKIFFDASALVIFIGVFSIEALAFFQYLTIEIPLEKCKGDIPISEVRRFIFCAAFGVEVSPNAPEWMWISTILFAFVFPAVLMFSLTFGLLYATNLHLLFGRYGKYILPIIAFITSLYGTRQLIGPFLIDMLAYGIWGIFGFIIPLILAVSIRNVGLTFLKNVTELEESVYSMFRVSKYYELDRYLQELSELENAWSGAMRLGVRNIEDIKSFLIRVMNLYKSVESKLKEVSSETKDARFLRPYYQILARAWRLWRSIFSYLLEISKQSNLPPPPPDEFPPPPPRLPKI